MTPAVLQAATALQDELDDLLVEYLSTLDVYQGVQERLSSELKKGYFDLARAKLALGPTRVGQSTYDLGECSPQFTIQIDSASDTTSSTTPRPPAFSLSLRPTPPPSSPFPSLPDPSPSTLRQRVPNPTSSLPSSPPPPQPTSPAPRSLLRDPMKQFAAFPPVALRDAQKGFGKVVQLLVERAEKEKGLEELEGRIREVRRGLREGAGGGAGGKGVQTVV